MCIILYTSLSVTYNLSSAHRHIFNSNHAHKHTHTSIFFFQYLHGGLGPVDRTCQLFVLVLGPCHPREKVYNKACIGGNFQCRPQSQGHRGLWLPWLSKKNPTLYQLFNSFHRFNCILQNLCYSHF